MGALLADVPHSRPIPVTVTSDDDDVRRALNTETSQYEGPTGIVGVLADVASLAGIPTMSVWAAVPHYVGQSPSPKAELALLHRLEDILQVPLEVSVLSEEAEAWERGVDELATEDPEVAAYVRQLEEAKDTAELPEATGESIAREFERYLKKRRKGGAGLPSGPEPALSVSECADPRRLVYAGKARRRSRPACQPNNLLGPVGAPVSRLLNLCPVCSYPRWP